jgi:hypothetical protein
LVMLAAGGGVGFGVFLLHRERRIGVAHRVARALSPSSSDPVVEAYIARTIELGMARMRLRLEDMQLNLRYGDTLNTNFALNIGVTIYDHSKEARRKRAMR